MPDFSLHERNLLALYNAGDRFNTIVELNNMASCLTPEEKELRDLTEGVLKKLRQMSDEEFERFADSELIF
ncbi:MAG: hypothetical protein CW338_10715 [Clostridiales bacterium]|nr:hypothetical protein [Clostridiales bacterium]